jgi:hypothetical protein
MMAASGGGHGSGALSRGRAKGMVISPHVFRRTRAVRCPLCPATCDSEMPSSSTWHSAWYTMAALLRYAWLFVFSLGMPADAAQKLSEHDVINYLAQSVCLDELRRPTAGTPLDANCRSKRPQAAADRVFYRKHDWPNADDLERATTGYQASDSVNTERGGCECIIQTFNFGDAPRTLASSTAVRVMAGRS